MSRIAKRHKTAGNQDFRIEDLVFDEIPLEDGRLHQQQHELSRILENCIDLADAKRQLDASSLAHSEWMIENWGEDMLMTAVHISKKWKQGF